MSGSGRKKAETEKRGKFPPGGITSRSTHAPERRYKTPSVASVSGFPLCGLVFKLVTIYEFIICIIYYSRATFFVPLSPNKYGTVTPLSSRSAAFQCPLLYSMPLLRRHSRLGKGSPRICVSPPRNPQPPNCVHDGIKGRICRFHKTSQDFTHFVVIELAGSLIFADAGSSPTGATI